MAEGRYSRVIDFRIKKYQLLRLEIYKRDKYSCVVCGWTPEIIPDNYDGRYTILGINKKLEIDHIRPRSKSGTHNKINLRTICNSCNSSKGSKERNK